MRPVSASFIVPPFQTCSLVTKTTHQASGAVATFPHWWAKGLKTVAGLTLAETYARNCPSELSKTDSVPRTGTCTVPEGFHAVSTPGKRGCPVGDVVRVGNPSAACRSVSRASMGRHLRCGYGLAASATTLPRGGCHPEVPGSMGLG